MSDLEKVCVTVSSCQKDLDLKKESNWIPSLPLRQSGRSGERVRQRSEGQLSCGDMGHPGRRDSHRLCHHTTGNHNM